MSAKRMTTIEPTPPSEGGGWIALSVVMTSVDAVDPENQKPGWADDSPAMSASQPPTTADPVPRLPNVVEAPARSPGPSSVGTAGSAFWPGSGTSFHRARHRPPTMGRLQPKHSVGSPDPSKAFPAQHAESVSMAGSRSAFADSVEAAHTYKGQAHRTALHRRPSTRRKSVEAPGADGSVPAIAGPRGQGRHLRSSPPLARSRAGHRRKI